MLDREFRGELLRCFTFFNCARYQITNYLKNLI